MPVKKDASGRRSVQAEVEVPGTPEEVWAAIATGPGISSWFVPSRVEEHTGGRILANFGPGMDSESKITAWDPPRKFEADSSDMGPDAPPLATEWTVEARGGGTCVVRVVHSWFSDSDDWDTQFGNTEHGWVAFFRILRIYLEHFNGRACSAFQLMGMASDPTKVDWNRMMSSLGLAEVALHEKVRTAPGAPPLSGVVESVGVKFPELLIRLEEPAPGIIHIFKLPLGDSMFVPIRVYLYGEPGRAAAAACEQAWQSWLNQQMPA
jgi:uncharacterized protein YndB with AHSA1/START domain